MAAYDKIVLLALADFASDTGDNIFPSVPTLATKTSVSLRKIQATIRSFQNQGLLELVAHASARRPRRYRLNVPLLQRLAASDAHGGAGAATSRPAPDDTQESTREPSGVHATTRRGAPGAPNPPVGSVREPPGSHPPFPPKGGEVASRRDPPLFAEARSPGFDAFWALYPRKEGELAARRAWRRRGCESIAWQICAALERQFRHLRREGGRWAPMPAKWIDGARWLDEPPAKPASLLTSATARNADVAREFVERGGRP